MEEAQQIAQGIIEMLKVKGRLDILPEVIDELDKEAVLLEHEVVIESAVALKEEDLKYLLDLIKAKLGHQPLVVEKVNPDLIGGVRLRIGDQVIDVSLKYRLDQLKKIVH